MTPVIPKGTRAVIFDAVGTLIHPEPSAAVVYFEEGRRFGSGLTQATIAARFATAFRRQEEIDRIAGFRTDPVREVARWRAIVREVLDDVTDAEPCFQSLYEHFARPDSSRTDRGNHGHPRETGGEWVSSRRRVELRRATFKRSRGERMVRAADCHSHEIGWRKPAPAFFAAACRAIEAKPHHALYVGNDAENDYDGPRAAGLSAVFFDPRGSAGNSVDRIASLRDLLINEE